MKVYDENFEKLTDKLRSSIMRCKIFFYTTEGEVRRNCKMIFLVTKMNDVQWNVFDVKTTNNLHDMHLPVVTMNINYNDNVENQTKSVSFSMNPEQFSVLLAGKLTNVSGRSY